MPKYCDVNVSAERVTTEAIPSSDRRINVEVSGVDIRELVLVLGTDALLDEIGKQQAKSHFDLYEEDELSAAE